ncbi:hypothetical protein [Saccharolobus islandicus]|uniref:Uncharacterized protein n=1 Tax=Saccharolobus islandicus (strain M.16.4 / Kamchatka \|nr:hypothetical protein [Sulfolobus islandicus]ACR41540.1 conserved hypothetical protein [Sulfolobus islandicus M.16.4]
MIVTKRTLILTISMLLNVLVALLPSYWWYYSAGGMVVIKDSLFSFYLEFLGKELEIGIIINYILFAFRFYVISVSLYYIYLALKKDVINNYLLITWISYLYLLDPLLFYLLFNYVVGYVAPTKYPLFIIGSQNMTVFYKNVMVTILVESYPTTYYWIALFAGTFNLISRIIINRLSKLS